MNRDDMTVLNELADVIRKNGSIKKTNLWKLTTLSIWQFDKLKQYIPATFEDIEYNRKKQTFTSRNNMSLFSKENLR